MTFFFIKPLRNHQCNKKVNKIHDNKKKIGTPMDVEKVNVQLLKATLKLHTMINTPLAFRLIHQFEIIWQ